MAGKMEQVLLIEPSGELTFFGPFSHAVNSLMTLTNPTDKRVCFKIKTTAPKRYCVKPNSGVVEPQQKIQVSVSLQPFNYDPNEKNRHKFMVQSQFAPDGEFNPEKLWKESDGSQFMDSKLRCIFVMPEEEIAKLRNNEESGSLLSSIKQEIQSPSTTGEIDPSLKKTVEEIKMLQEEASHLRQENLQLKEEALRQKRLAATLSTKAGGSSQVGSFNRSDSPARSYSSSVVATANPNAMAMNQIHIYGAIIIFVIGLICGKWIF